MSAYGQMTGRLAPNALLKGRYLIVETAGMGGMGAVYEAVDIRRQPKRRVALKELSQSPLTSHEEIEKAKKRFQGEANMLRSLDHPNLPRVYDSFEEDGRSYLVMEFIEGQTLLQMLQASGGRPLPTAEIVSYACQLCSVLDYLHRQYPPIIFRDLKPSNVMVKADGQVMLIDFGIARFFKAGQHADTEPLGSLAYASPQQLDGAQTNVRSDLYSLGATLHHCLTGKMPTYAHNRFIYPSVREKNPQVPPKIDHIIMSLVEVKEDLRPNSAETVRLQLEEALEEFEELTQNVAKGAIYIPQQQPLTLAGNASGSSPNNATFSVNRRPDVSEPLPDWMTDLATFSKNVIAWWTISVFPAILRLLRSVGTRIIASRGRVSKPVTFADVRRGVTGMGKQVIVGWGVVSEYVWLWVRSWSSRVLTPAFISLLLLRLALIIGASVYLFRVFQGSSSIVAFCLSLLLLVITGAGSISTRIREPVARMLLFCTSLTMVMACIGLLATSDAQQLLRTITFSQLFTALLVIFALITLVRSVNRLGWVDYATLVVVAVTCALLQYAFGLKELASIAVLPPDSYRLLLYGSTLFLLLIAFTFLCRMGSSFKAFDRLAVLVLACIFVFLQLTVGYTELHHLALLAISPGKLTIAYADILLLAAPLLGASIAVFTGHRSAFASRVAIFLLALATAVLQNTSTADLIIRLPFSSSTLSPLTSKVVDIFSLNQIFIYGGLLIAGLLLLIRLVRKFSWIDRPAVYVIATVSAFLQLSLAPQVSSFFFFGIDTSAINQDLLIAFNQITASGLLLLVIAGAGITVVAALVQLARQHAGVDRWARQVTNRFTWVDGTVKLIDRIIIVGIALTATSLVTFFSDMRQVLSLSIPAQGMTLTSGSVVMIILALLTVVALFRINKAFNRWDCLTVLLSAGICALLAVGNTSLQQITPPQLSNIQQFMGHVLQGNIPALLSFVGLLASAAISLLWLRRTPSHVDHVLRFVLFILFAGPIACLFLQLFWPVWLLVALIMLIHGVFVAIQMERVR